MISLYSIGSLYGCGIHETTQAPSLNPTRISESVRETVDALTSALPPTKTSTPDITNTSTVTTSPTITNTPTVSFTPTFDFPKVTVNKALAACMFGPAKTYLWARDLKQGDTGVIWGRAPYGISWFYVRMDKLDIPCWVSSYVVDVVGDPKSVIVQSVWLPIANNLYHPPENVDAFREGDQVKITWDQVEMTADDDRGYFLEVWICQAGELVWVPASVANQYQTEYTFTDEKGCSEPSSGEIRTVEKHGYTDAVPIPWPPQEP